MSVNHWINIIDILIPRAILQEKAFFFTDVLGMNWFFCVQADFNPLGTNLFFMRKSQSDRNMSISLVINCLYSLGNLLYSKH